MAYRQWFEAIDVDRNGRLDSRELQRALALGNLHFSLAVCAHMIRIHDRDNSGSIEYAEFERLHNFLSNMQNSFTYFDADRSGQLSKGEVQQALTHAGFRLDGPSFNSMFRAFDPDGNANLGLPEYIAMTLFLQSATATFQAFDQHRQGRITLDFNQWIYAAANTI